MKKRADGSAAASSDELVEYGKSMDSAKRELAALRRQRDELSTVAGVSGQVALLRRDASDKDDLARRAFDVCKPRLAAHFGSEVRSWRLRTAELCIWLADVCSPRSLIS